MISYESFYGFREKPFSLTPDPAFLYLGPAHRKAMSYLTYAIESGEGFVVITGEIGSGKTTLVRNLIRGLRPGTRCAYLVNPGGTFRQLMRIVMDALDVVPLGEQAPREALLKAFEALVRERAGKGETVVLIFDEAQNLDPAALEEIRMLSNLETDKRKLVQIVLAGQPELRTILASPRLEQLNQRIAVRCHLEPLSAEETQHYIRHRIEAAGGRNGSVGFSPDGCRTIHACSSGIPRKINIACNAVLLAGFVDERRSFDAAYVLHALEDLGTSTDLDVKLDELAPAPEAPEAPAEAKAASCPLRRHARLLALAAAAAAALAAWLLFGGGAAAVANAFNALF